MKEKTKISEKVVIKLNGKEVGQDKKEDQPPKTTG